MTMDAEVLAYQLLTLLVGVGAQAYLLAVHRFSPSPLGSRFLQFSALFTGFYLMIGVTAYVVRVPGADLTTLELVASTIFFGLYAAMVLPWTAFLLELVQRPYRGLWRHLARTLSLLGVFAPVVLWTVPGARLEAFRIALQAVYVPLVLVYLAGITWVVWERSGPLLDRWKRRTARGLVLCVMAGFPLFVLDALWPWIQLQAGWVPRALNFHGLFYVALHLFVAWRWTRHVQELRLPLPSAPEPGQELDRERLRMWGLTFREEEVVRLLCSGRTNQQIADGLKVSLGTVKNHVYHAFQKSGASSRKELLEMLTPPTSEP